MEGMERWVKGLQRDERNEGKGVGEGRRQGWRKWKKIVRETCERIQREET